MSTVTIPDQQPMRQPKKHDGFSIVEWMTATAVIDRPVGGPSIATYLPIFLLGSVMWYSAALNGYSTIAPAESSDSHHDLLSAWPSGG